MIYRMLRSVAPALMLLAGGYCPHGMARADAGESKKPNAVADETGASAPSANPDRHAPPLSLDCFVGPDAPDELTWEALRGKVVVIEFWATWCVPCVRGIPHLNELAETYRDRDVRFLFISDESRAIVERFLRVQPIKGWVGLDPDRSTFEAFRTGIGIPKTYVVDGRGVMAAGPLAPSELTPAMLDAALSGRPILRPEAAEPAPEPAPPTPTSDLPASPLDPAATWQFLIGPASPDGAYMESSPGVYVNTSVNLETLIVRLFGLSTPSRVRWEVPRPEDKLRFIAKTPENREELLEGLALPALEASLGLSIRREKIRTEVYVLSAPDGPGRDLERAVPAKPGHHRFHQFAADNMLFASDNDFARLVANLERLLGRPVIDETGFSGQWNWGLRFEPGDAESLIRAARDQLGLSLVPDRREIEMVVIRTSEETGGLGRSDEGRSDGVTE